MISDAFIEAVAAIVLQTAIRRFMAIRKVQRLCEYKSALPQTKGQGATDNSSPRQTPSPQTENAGKHGVSPDKQENMTEEAKQVKPQEPHQQEKGHHRGHKVGVGHLPGAAMSCFAALFDFLDYNWLKFIRHDKIPLYSRSLARYSGSWPVLPD